MVSLGRPGIVSPGPRLRCPKAADPHPNGVNESAPGGQELDESFATVLHNARNRFGASALARPPGRENSQRDRMRTPVFMSTDLKKIGFAANRPLLGAQRFSHGRAVGRRRARPVAPPGAHRRTTASALRFRRPRVRNLFAARPLPRDLRDRDLRGGGGPVVQTGQPTATGTGHMTRNLRRLRLRDLIERIRPHTAISGRGRMAVARAGPFGDVRSHGTATRRRCPPTCSPRGFQDQETEVRESEVFSVAIGSCLAGSVVDSGALPPGPASGHGEKASSNGDGPPDRALTGGRPAHHVTARCRSLSQLGPRSSKAVGRPRAGGRSIRAAGRR